MIDVVIGFSIYGSSKLQSSVVYFFIIRFLLFLFIYLPFFFLFLVFGTDA